MKTKSIFFYVLLLTIGILGLISCNHSKGKGITERIAELDANGELIVQFAELEIDSTQLAPYLEFLKEGIQTAIEKEPGVLTMYCMAHTDDPTKIKLVEVYANKEAYDSHIASPHFQKYKTGTLQMVKSLKLTRTKPILFAAKQY